MNADHEPGPPYSGALSLLLLLTGCAGLPPDSPAPPPLAGLPGAETLARQLTCPLGSVAHFPEPSAQAVSATIMSSAAARAQLAISRPPSTVAQLPYRE